MTREERVSSSSASRFQGDTGPFAEILADLDVRCLHVSALSRQTFTLELHVDFEELPQAQATRAFRESPAGYILSRDVIAINRRYFDPLVPAVQRGIVLHEMGHNVRHRNNELEPLGDCIGADLTVIGWGLADELIEARELAYGPEYGRLLRSALTGDIALVREQLEVWANKVRAGIIILPRRN
jgi:hypothetical protein